MHANELLLLLLRVGQIYADEEATMVCSASKMRVVTL